ncbi:MAG: DMT family transporter [Hyphomicrobiales bacterium]|nr:DMT family transporter [Hyphomicrobiales bacterium]
MTTRPVFAGILLMLLGMFLFSVNDVLGKWLVATYTVGQVLLFRSGAAMLVLAPAIAREGVEAIANPPNRRLHVLRVVLSTIDVAFFYWAVTYLPLAQAVTFFLAGPIFVALLARPFLGEHISLSRWFAIAFGFVGVGIALNPGADFGWPSLIAMSGALAFAGMMVVTRKLKGTSDTTLVAWQSGAALGMGVLLAPFGWVTPSWRDVALLSLLGVVALFGHMATNRSLKLAPASTVVPYQYSLIVWVGVLGYAVFGDIPPPSTVVGALIIVASGFWIFWDEQRAAKTVQP